MTHLIVLFLSCASPSPPPLPPLALSGEQRPHNGGLEIHLEQFHPSEYHPVLDDEDEGVSQEETTLLGGYASFFSFAR
jgi:hypothetical protein